MSISLEFWYIFPLALLFATLSMAIGIGSPVFFSPLFIVVLKFEPSIAVGTALLTQLFGLSSGFIAYARSRLIDYNLGLKLLIFSVPFAIFGTMYGKLIPAEFLKGLFAVGILFIGYQLFKSWKNDQKQKNDNHTDKHNFHYVIRDKKLGGAITAVGGLFVGMISVGLAELLNYYLIAKSKIPTPVAVATIIFVLATTVFFASMGHLYEFVYHTDQYTIDKVMNVVIFSIPGVIIGGQIGPLVQKYLPQKMIKIAMSGLFFLIGTFTIGTLLV